MAYYDIFREQLAIKYPSYGHALWRPSPKNPDRPVQIGDVGFIRRGKFHRLFNALLPADDPSHELGVPEYHEPLVPSLLNHFDTDSLDLNNYSSAGVSVKPGPGYNDGPNDFRQVSFQSDRTRGAAVLSLPVTAWREDTLARGDFGRWIVKHIDSWIAFGRKLGRGVDEMEEIILVTGCDRTRSWTNVAFSGNPAEAQVSFGVKVDGHDTRISFQFLPEKAQGAVMRHGPEGTNLPENQCVFIRGFRVTRPFRILPRHLKVAAGPSSDPGGSDYDSSTERVSIPATSKYRDPLHLLLDYIAERASDCEMVIAHDDDLAAIDGLGHDTSLETLEPEVMMDLLRKSNIEIHKVLSVLSPTDSGPNTDVSLVKVAMVSMTSQNWNNEPQPLGQSVDLGYASESRGSSPAGVQGNSPVPTIRGDINKRETSLLADDDESAPSTPQDSTDSTLRGIGHATEDVLLAIGKIRDSHSNVWPSLNKFTLMGRHGFLIAAVVACCVVSLLRWVFSFTWAVIFKLFVTVLLASFLSSVWFKREFRYRRRLGDICERMEVLQRRVTSLQSNLAGPAVVSKELAGSRPRTWGRNVVADVRNDPPIAARANPANLGILGQNGMQAIPEGSTSDGLEVPKTGLGNGDALRRTRRRPNPNIASPPASFSPHPIEFVPRPRSAPPTNTFFSSDSNPRFSVHLPGYLPFLQHADTSFLGNHAPPYLSGPLPAPPTHQSSEEPRVL